MSRQLPTGRRRRGAPSRKQQQWKPWHRRTLWILGGLIAFFVAVGVVGGEQPTTPAANPSSPAGGGAVAAVPAAAAPTVAAPAATADGDVVDVARVIDGDTFELADGRRVRVLGIDSCEADTYGGEQATTWARSLLASYRTITLTEEPGVGTDQYGRLLRYVHIDGEDFGVQMVKWDHTGVYQGENDASPKYVRELYANDTQNSANPPSGRECGDPYPPAPASGGVHLDNDDNHNSRDGSIIPACRHKWWC